MSVVRLHTKALKGLSFSVPELILIKGWSEASGFRMVVRLDHGSDAEDYEEVLALHIGDSSMCHWLIWRDSNRVFLQPLIGRTRQYVTVAEAFESLAEKARDVLTNIKPEVWPA